MATTVLELYTTNAVLLSKALISVVEMIGSDAFSSVMYLGAIIGFLAMLATLAFGQGRSEWVGYVLAVIIVSTGVKTTTNVGLIDSAGGAIRVVNDVPVVIAIPFYIINSGARVLTDLGSIYFDPAGATLLKDGVGYGTALIASMQNTRWKEADKAVPGLTDAQKATVSVQATIEGYINDCYIPYITKKDTNAKVTSVLYADTTSVETTADVWELFRSDIVQWTRNFSGAQTAASTPIDSCSKQFLNIKAILVSAGWKTAIINDFAHNYYTLSSAMDRPGSASAAPAGTVGALNADTAQIASDIRKYVNYLFNATGGTEQAATMLLMDYLSKALNVGLSQDGRLTLTEYQGRAGSAFDDAIGQNNIRMAAEGDFFVKYAGNMTRFIEFLTYLWLPITLFAMLAMPGGIKQLKNLFFLYLWIQSWPFAFNIINYYQVLDVLETLRPTLAGGMNMYSIESAWANTTRAYATSQMFLGMLPILTMALLTGNMMSMSRLSDKVSGQENLDEKRIRRDTEKVEAQSVVNAQTSQAIDRDGNLTSADSNVKGLNTNEIAKNSTESANLSDTRSKTAGVKSSAAFNQLISNTTAGQNVEGIMEQVNDSVTVKDDVTLNSGTEKGQQYSDTYKKMEAVQAQLKASASMSVKKSVSIFSAMAGLDTSLSDSETDEVAAAMQKIGLSKSGVAQALAASDAFQVTDSTTINNTSTDTDQVALTQTVNEQSEQQRQHALQAQKQRAYSAQVTSKKALTTTQVTNVADEFMADANKYNDFLQDGTGSKEQQKEARDFAEKWFGDKNGLDDFVGQTSGQNRRQRAQHIASQQGHFLDQHGIKNSSMINHLMMQELIPGHKIADIFMESNITNPVAHRGDDVDGAATGFNAEVAASDPASTLTDSNGSTVANNIAPVAALKDKVITGTANSSNTDLSQEDQAKIKALRDKEKQKKLRLAAIKAEGEASENTVNAELYGVNKSDASYSDVATALNADYVVNNVLQRGVEGLGEAISPALDFPTGNVGESLDKFENTGSGGRQDNLADKFTARAARTFVAASNGYKNDIDNGVHEHDAELNRYGELMKLMGPDASEAYNKNVENYRINNQIKGNTAKDMDIDTFLSPYKAALQESRIPTTRSANDSIASGLDEKGEPSILQTGLSWIGLESEDTEQRLKDEQNAESALSIAGVTPNAMESEAEYQSEQIFQDNLKTLLQLRGGETLKPIDMQYAKMNAAQPYADAAGQGVQYREMMSTLLGKLFDSNTGALTGNADAVNREYQASEFGQYDNSTTNGFDRIAQKVDAAQSENIANKAFEAGDAKQNVKQALLPQADNDLTPKDQDFMERYRDQYNSINSANSEPISQDGRFVAEIMAYREYSRANGEETDVAHAENVLIQNYDTNTQTLNRTDEVMEYLENIEIDKYRNHAAATFDGVSPGQPLPAPDNMAYKNTTTVSEVLNDPNTRNK